MKRSRFNEEHIAYALRPAEFGHASTLPVCATRQHAASERQQRIERDLQAIDEIEKSLSGKTNRRQADTA